MLHDTEVSELGSYSDVGIDVHAIRRKLSVFLGINEELVDSRV